MMPRTTSALLVAALLLLSGGGAAAARDFQELDGRVQKAVAEAAKAYFSADHDNLYYPRKAFKDSLETLGDDFQPLRDMALLRSIVYQGRTFREEFTHKDWLRANNAKHSREKNLYNNIESEGLRLTFTEPKRYNRRNLERAFPRAEPFPLLVAIGELNEIAGSEAMGQATIEARYPQSEARALYEDWFVLAPWAARATFLDEKGLIRHDFSTSVLSDFWKRYHVDFGRIVLDGHAPAVTAMAATFPFVYAGLVLRGGTPDPTDVPNYAHLPVYVLGDAALKDALTAAGHKDVTVGDAAGLPAWLGERRRAVPRDFRWVARTADQEMAHWISIFRADWSIETRTLDVAIQGNTIKIDAKGVEEIRLYLNDDIVNLDEEVKLVVNGHEESLGVLPREFKNLFDREPPIRREMYFGWLYPTHVLGVKVRPPAAGTPAPAEPAAPTAPTAPTPPTEEEGDEETAARFWEAALENEADGNVPAAIALLRKVIGAGKTSYLDRAKEKLQALGGS
jgi:hypothetical protein